MEKGHSGTEGCPFSIGDQLGMGFLGGKVQEGNMVNFYGITLREHAKLVADLFNEGRWE
jgi:hypothetical protein